MMLTLKYGSMVVGKITDPDDQDGTWFGDFESEVDPKSGGMAKRLAEYIAFCKDWNERVENGGPKSPSTSEFNAYSDLLNSGLWSVEDESKNSSPIQDAPNFQPEGDVSWCIGENRAKPG